MLYVSGKGEIVFGELKHVGGRTAQSWRFFMTIVNFVFFSFFAAAAYVRGIKGKWEKRKLKMVEIKENLLNMRVFRFKLSIKDFSNIKDLNSIWFL